MRIRGSEVVLCLMLVVAALGCAANVLEDAELEVGVAREALLMNRACNDSFESIYAQPRNLPRHDASRRGDIVRCSTGRTIAVEEVRAGLARRGFIGVAAQRPVQIYRLTYRTERLQGRGDVSSAILLAPAPRLRATSESGQVETEESIETDALRRGGGPPLIVFGHGTVPYGQSCGYSRLDPGSDESDRELGALVAFATQGYTVIMPDYAGFVAGSPISGYMLSDDEARSLLDATRAVRKLVRNPPSRVVMVGHSQGGHAVLSAQAQARSYGLSGQLVGVAALAPFWAPGRTFGAIFSPEFMFNTTEHSPQLAFAVEYFYTHAELYDGRGRGVELFKPQVRGALSRFVASCNFYEPLRPEEFGNTAADFLQPDFYNAVTACGVYGGEACGSPLASTWHNRFRADRPPLDRSGAPVLMWAAKNDRVIDPSLSKCAIDKIASDLPAGSPAKFTFCGDDDADHESLIGDQLGWITRWIEARARGAAEPEACPGESAIQGSEPLSCLTPPGNVD